MPGILADEGIPEQNPFSEATLMVSMIFHPEISSLESQVAQLQAQIAAAQTRITALGEAEFVASGAIQIVEEAVTKISELAPDAIARFWAALLKLNDSSSPELFLSAKENLTAPNMKQDKPQKSEPLLNGESCAIDLDAYWATQAPDGSSWEWASPLCCQMEDAPFLGQACELASCLQDCPAESLRGQVVELCCPLEQNVTAIYENVSLKREPTTPEEIISVDRKLSEDNGAEKSLFELVDLNGVVAYMKRVDNGQIAAAYVGFNSRSKAKLWADWLAVTHSVATKAEVRVAKRLVTKYEVKLSGVSFKSIERLVGCNFNLDPRKALPDAPKREPERVPSQIELDNFQPGDVVKSVTVKSWSYTVLGVRDDGFLEVERIGVNPPIRSTLSPASVELIRRGGVVEIASQELAEYLEKQAQESIQPLLHAPARIDADDVPAGIRLTPGRDDLLVQYEVWLTAEVRVMGRPQVQQKQVGMLTETQSGIEALRPRATSGKHFDRTLDAVAYLISGSGLKPVAVKSEPVLVGATAAVDGDEF